LNLSLTQAGAVNSHQFLLVKIQEPLTYGYGFCSILTIETISIANNIVFLLVG
jgi:hypothetical protein